jgi:uncharacterized protein (TIGR00375 family)
MPFFADFHIHSGYSRATSRDMTPEGIWKWAQLKGITVMGTGDFTHPAWFRELREKLEPLENGLFRLRAEHKSRDVPASCRREVSFLLTGEISCIYSKAGKTRKVHALIFAPDFTTVARINEALSRIGNLNADGRPILGLDAKVLLDITLEASSEAMFVPAHAWTPHFSVFGAVSGFDSLEECFEELTPHICAIETGLSSDPAMNWRVSALDRLALISNSDAHSTAKIGREANIFDTELSYAAITGAMERKKGFQGTIEFFPEEGKYHYDGHRACGIRLSPAQTMECDYVCPKCGRRLTVGVMHRVQKLADREIGVKPATAGGYTCLIPLPEILAEVTGVGAGSKRVTREYHRLLESLGSELTILREVSLDDIECAASRLTRVAIERMRTGKVHIAPGYDGEYGKIKIFEDSEVRAAEGQMALL